MTIKRKILNAFPDDLYLRLLFRKRMKKRLCLSSPQTFNEKLQWLKLYDRRPEYTEMVDKFAGKKYVSDKIGEQYVVPSLGVWNSFDEIDFSILPDQFVLKCTHDSGGIVICKNKADFDYEAAKKKLTECLKRNYYYNGREWPYKNVRRRIIAETYIGDSLNDYKLMCFNGRVEYSFVCSDRYSDEGLHVTFFDRNWNIMDFERHYPRRKEGIEKPDNYEKMIELAETLSKGIPFVRVDFYDVAGKIYWGEMTFYPGDGFEEFEPEEWDYKLGQLIKLPEKKRK